MDCVFHLAAVARIQPSIKDPVPTMESNVMGTLNVLLAARDARVRRIVYSASSSSYGDQETLPLHEEMSSKFKSPYALSKYVGEELCRLFSNLYKIETVSLRYFNVYGPRNNPDGAYALVIAKFLKQRIEGKPMTITGDGKQTRDFTNVKDVVMANILAMESDKVVGGEVMNIGAGKNQSIKQIADLIGGPIIYIPARLEPHDTLADNSLAIKFIGWKPTVNIEDGVAELKKLADL